jgi:hypothetical protein
MEQKFYDAYNTLERQRIRLEKEILLNEKDIENALIEAKENSKIVHVLKIEKAYMCAVASYKKNFELRKNDRNYKEGDYLLLKTEGFEDIALFREIRYIFHGGQFGLDKDYVILSI